MFRERSVELTAGLHRATSLVPSDPHRSNPMQLKIGLPVEPQSYDLGADTSLLLVDDDHAFLTRLGKAMEKNGVNLEILREDWKDRKR